MWTVNNVLLCCQIKPKKREFCVSVKFSDCNHINNCHLFIILRSNSKSVKGPWLFLPSGKYRPAASCIKSLFWASFEMFTFLVPLSRLALTCLKARTNTTTNHTLDFNCSPHAPGTMTDHPHTITSAPSFQTSLYPYIFKWPCPISLVLTQLSFPDYYYRPFNVIFYVSVYSLPCCVF